MSETPGLPRVVILIPATDTTVEKELPSLLAGRATCHFSRMRLTSVTREGLAAMEVEAIAEAALFSDIEVDLVLFACTSGTFIYGPEYERELAVRIADAAQTPVVTTASAMALALKARGTRVRLRTPYDEVLTTAEVGYLKELGFTVTSSLGLGITVDNNIAALEADDLMSFVTGDDDADVLMLSCTNVRSLHLISRLSLASGLPVVTSNLAASERVIAVLSGAEATAAKHPMSLVRSTVSRDGP